MPDLEALNKRSAERYRRSTIRFVALAVVGLVAVLALGFVTQRQEAQIRRLISDQRQAVYTSCLSRAANLRRLNASYDRLIVVEQGNTFIDDALRAKRIAAYRTFQLVVPDCRREAGPGAILNDPSSSPSP